MPFPDFIVLGASKAGTSSMYHYLDSHPDVYTPLKEPNFFALNGVDLPLAGPGDQEWYDGSYVEDEAYRILFEEAQEYEASGEASPTYLHSKHAPQKIHEYIPDARLIAILRDPADRAFSHYRHFSESGLETESFEQALKDEKSRLEAGWFWPRYIEAGRYHTQLSRYLEYFPEDQLKIYLFREFTGNTREVMQDVFQFLGVDPTRGPRQYVRRNVSGSPRLGIVEYVLSGGNPIAETAKKYLPNVVKDAAIKIRNANKTEKNQSIGRKERKMIIEELEGEIKRLEELIGRDLTTWKEY